MKTIHQLVCAGLATLVLGLGLTGTTAAQQGTLKQQIIGTWTLVSVYDVGPDGKKSTDVWGEGVKGSVAYDGSGRFTYMIVSAARPKHTTITPLTARTPVGPMIGYFGTYSVNETDKSVTLSIERCTFPNWEGTDRKILLTVKGDRMSQTLAPTPGANVPNIEWVRAK